jgi:FkbM family methyltransferase
VRELGVPQLGVQLNLWQLHVEKEVEKDDRKDDRKTMTGKSTAGIPGRVSGRQMGKDILKSAYSALPCKPAIFSVMRRLGIVPSPGMQDRLWFEGVLEAEMDGAHFRMAKGGKGEVLESRIFWQGLGYGWESYSIRMWAALARCHDVIFDIGANTGVYSLLAFAVNPRAQVFAFEPVPRIFERLRRNVELNRFNIALEPVAASNYDGGAAMWEPVGCDVSYCGTVNSNLYQPEVPAEKLSIRAVRLSSFARSHALSHLGLVKIDVESHEPEVIEGMGEFLEQRPTLLFEVWNPEVSGKDVGALVEVLLKERGYLFFATDEESPFRPAEHIRSHDPVKRYTNHLACSEEIARKVGLLGGTLSGPTDLNLCPSPPAADEFVRPGHCIP